MFKSILSNWATLVVEGAISFVITPVLIRGLGDFHYGMWILVASVLDHYGLLDMGIRTTLQRFVARHHATDQRQDLSETFATALAISSGVCLLLCVATFILSGILPQFFALTGAPARLFSRLVVLLGLSIAITFPAQVLGSYLCGLMRFDLFNLAAISSAALRALLFLAVLRLGYNVIAVAGVTLGIAVFSLMLHYLFVRRVDPGVSFNWRRTSLKRMRELFSFSLYVFLSSAGDFFRFRVDSIVIARWLTMTMVTPFNVATRLVEYFRSVLMSVMAPMLPAMSALDGQSREKDLHELFLRSTRMTSLLSLFIGSLLLLDGRELLSLWVGPRFMSSYSLLATLTVGYIVSLGQMPCISLILARGKHRPLGWWNLSEGLANLGLSIYWAKEYGLIGVALGTVVPMMVTKLTIQPWYALHVLHLGVRDYILGALRGPILGAGLFLGVARLLTTSFPAHGVLQLGVAVTWQTLLFGVLAYWIGLARSDRQLLWRHGRQFAANLRVLRPA